MSFLPILFAVVVSLSTWMTPQRGHLYGWLIVYGNMPILEANADYRSYDTQPYDDCLVAGMSPKNLGQIVWIRPTPKPGHDNTWWGPCLVVDTVARVDHYHSVYEINDMLEIPRWLAVLWGTEYGLKGEAYYGRCPPRPGTVPQRHSPPLRIDPIRPVIQYSGWPYPPQQFPITCTHTPTYVQEPK